MAGTPRSTVGTACGGGTSERANDWTRRLAHFTPRRGVTARRTGERHPLSLSKDDPPHPQTWYPWWTILLCLHLTGGAAGLCLAQETGWKKETTFAQTADEPTRSPSDSLRVPIRVLDADDPGVDSLAFQILRQLAREDTVPIYVLGEWVDVRGHRPTLEEILGWCIEHEKNRFAPVHDVTYIERLQTLVLFDPGDPKARRIVTESVSRVYGEVPEDRWTRISLGSRTYDSKEDDPEVELQAEARETQRSIADLPFFFQDLSDYRFEIQDRKILSDRVLYRIGFEPRSEFASAPTGNFLVDTADYQILRAELSLTENVPYPLIVKGVDHVILDRKKVEDVWVTDRVRAQISLRKPLGIPFPRMIQTDLQIEDLRLDQGVPDSVWNR